MKRIFICFMSTIFLLTGTQAFAGKVINEKLPKWINLDVQFRHRLEYKDNFDFNSLVKDNETIHLIRTRLGLHLMPVEQIKMFLQFQDARVWDQQLGSKTGNENYADFRQGYVELKKLYTPDSEYVPDVSFRLGRQELSYGAQRLIGGFDWSNVAQTFDSGKMTMDFKDLNLSVDGFGGTKTPLEAPRDFDNWFDNGAKDRFVGYYATYKGIKDVLIDQYFIKRDAKRLSFGPAGARPSDTYTAGGRVKGKIGTTNFDYEVEAAKQWGEFGPLDVDAQMAIAILGYTFADVMWTPRFSFEYDYGSGDDDSTDGELNTFNNLYPTNHLFYGYMDRISLQNLNDYHVQVAVNPSKKTMVSLGYHMLYLDTSNDSLYSAARTVLRTASTAGTDEHVGNEIDLLVKHKVNDHLNILGGYSHFFSGDFLDQTGKHDDGDFFYLQSVLEF